jgi:hypothetical protein
MWVFWTEPLDLWLTTYSLHGPPLTNLTAVSALVEHGITVALGVKEAWNARNAFMDAAWVCLSRPTVVYRVDA